MPPEYNVHKPSIEDKNGKTGHQRITHSTPIQDLQLNLDREISAHLAALGNERNTILEYKNNLTLVNGKVVRKIEDVELLDRFIDILWNLRRKYVDTNFDSDSKPA